jgi:hypothetical protein
MPYEPKAIEPKWQAYWREHAVFASTADPEKPKFYVLDMFPYPSGAGLHVGHPKGYIATDVVSRYKRMRGFNVLHPMGWDAFGLPAEQYAIETGTHPRETTARNVDNLRRQLQLLGTDYDWSRENNTTDPHYMRWTQWIFRKLYERDLAYLAEVPVNWCPALGTVLANEEVIDGRSERGGHPVVRTAMRQWMLRITAYADRLIDDLDGVDWPEPIKKMQRDWVGRSVGSNIHFELAIGEGETIEVFTTRPDTLFGATYMVLAPEHPLVEKITTPEQRSEVEAYVEAAARRSERARIADAKEKTGVFTGGMAAHPVTGAPLPVWIADYVLATYGTGAVMAVRVARRARQGWPHRQLQAPRLAVQPAALLGRAVPGDAPRGRNHRAARRRRTTATAPGTRRLQALGRVRTAARALEGVAGDDGSGDRRARASRHQHDAAVGGQLLVLPALCRALLDARRSLRGWRRARGTPPALRALLAQGLLRPRPRAHRRAVPEAPEPGDDPRLQLPLLRRRLR